MSSLAHQPGLETALFYVRTLNPFSTAVPMRGQTILIPSGSSPKRDCGSKRVKSSFSLQLLHSCLVLRCVRSFWVVSVLSHQLDISWEGSFQQAATLPPQGLGLRSERMFVSFPCSFVDIFSFLIPFSSCLFLFLPFFVYIYIYIYYYFSCHPTMCSMIFNMDHS